MTSENTCSLRSLARSLQYDNSFVEILRGELPKKEGSGYGDGHGSGYGDGHGYGDGSGSGYGSGYGSGSGDGHGYGERTK